MNAAAVATMSERLGQAVITPARGVYVGQSPFGPNVDDQALRHPDRVGSVALQHDSLGMAGQHRLCAVAFGIEIDSAFRGEDRRVYAKWIA